MTTPSETRETTLTVYVAAEAKLWTVTHADYSMTVHARIPGSGHYTSTYNNWANWFDRGVEGCVARIAEVHDGFGNEPDWIPPAVYATWPLNVLATMCGEWEGGT